jgi:hypothetical protein
MIHKKSSSLSSGVPLPVLSSVSSICAFIDSLQRERVHAKKESIAIPIAVTVCFALAGVALGPYYSTSTAIPTSLAYAQPTSINTPTTATGDFEAGERFTAQKTAVSNAGTLPIHEAHQIVKVLPARDDDKVWVGTVSWASSKPVELELWHSYNSSIEADAEHGQPVTAPIDNGTIAFTLLKTDSGTSLPSGSTNFAGDALSFHTLDGSKFTVAYTVDALAKSLNK